MDVPIEILPELRDGYEQELIRELDLISAGITCVIWATGYKFDFSMVKLPVLDGDGFPIQKRGVTEYPGLYLIGLPFLHNSNSGNLYMVGDDSKHVVSVILKTGESPKGGGHMAKGFPPSEDRQIYPWVLIYILLFQYHQFQKPYSFFI